MQVKMGDLSNQIERTSDQFTKQLLETGRRLLSENGCDCRIISIKKTTKRFPPNNEPYLSVTIEADGHGYSFQISRDDSVSLLTSQCHIETAWKMLIKNYYKV